MGSNGSTQWNTLWNADAAPLRQAAHQASEAAERSKTQSELGTSDAKPDTTEVG